MIIYLEIVIDDKTGKVLSSTPFNPNQPKVEEPKREEGYFIYLLDNSLEVTQETSQLLNVDIGDKLDVYYIEANGVIAPVIAKSGLFGSSGNKLTKSYTISFRQSKQAQLRIYGTKFKVELDKNGKFAYLIPIDGIPKLFKQDLEEVQILDTPEPEEPKVEKKHFSFKTVGSF